MDEKQWDEERWSAQGMVLALSPLRVPRTKPGRRKLRLFACGHVRACLDSNSDDTGKQFVEVAEQFADGQVGRNDLNTAEQRGRSLKHGTHPPISAGGRERRAAVLATEACHPQPLEAAFNMTAYPPDQVPTPAGMREKRLLCDLLRCVFGNPFRKPVFPKTWRTETVTALAAGIYEGRAFDRLPIVADALEEAGCDDPAMLSHLRGDGPHCRGCWVLDLALGKG